MKCQRAVAAVATGSLNIAIHRLLALRLATGENFPDTFWPHGSAIPVMRTMTVVRFALKHFSEKGRKMQQSTSICTNTIDSR